MDQVGRDQGSQRRLRLQLQFGRQPANHPEVRWASLDEERAQQSPMERLERARQGGLTALGPCGWSPRRASRTASWSGAADRCE
jgi:hypothetical protein